MFKHIKSDIRAVFDNDPAARSRFEVVFTYAGLHAIWAHRMAHSFTNAVGLPWHAWSLRSAGS